MKADLSTGNLIIEIGRFFLNAPYQAGTLEAQGKEKLVVNFKQFDCTTFIETVLALTRYAANGKLTSGEFRKALKIIRYRGGEIEGYSSRLHYFTDWLRDNEKKKVLKDVSRLLGGAPQRKAINYMNTHRASYPVLKNEVEFQKMKIIEKNLSRKTFHIIGKDKFGAIKNKIQNGDIIAFATNQDGLDVAHMGFALWQRKGLRLLHASSKEGAVVISGKTLAAYLKQNKKYCGLILARPR